jgi:hypothetical protein
MKFDDLVTMILENAEGMNTSWQDTYDWEEERNSYYDVTTHPDALTLEDSLTIDQIKPLKFINVFKSVYDPNFKWIKSKDKRKKPYL